MSLPDFASFYSGVHPGKYPFPWQISLAEFVIAKRVWPSIAVPTASGKTSVLDVAVFSIAAQADLPREQRTAPLRTFFIVDRRLVVDDAFRHAKAITDALANPKDDAVAEVARRLWKLRSSSGEGSPLAVARLRGGMYASESWIDAPNQPLLCISTVDQTGSRLLFRGYGVTDERRPIDAGLVGNDSLLIVDEAHLSKPFVDTLAQVQRLQADCWSTRPMHRPLQVAVMSATLGQAPDRIIIPITKADRENDVLAKRFRACKKAELRDAVSDLPATAASEALKLLSDKASAIGVVLNTVKHARETFELVRKAEVAAVLLTGRIRPWDRDEILREYLPQICAGRQRDNSQPLVVVATQTIEVGADLDFDALVTEAAPLDALRQRFGRLDRYGDLVETHAVILRPKSSDAAEWIYGEPLRTTWKFLNESATEKGRAKVVDFGIDALEVLLKNSSEETLNCTKEDGPLLLPAHVDAWVQTNPRPEPEPDVAPFLHGKNGSTATDVQIIWRSDLPAFDKDVWTEIISLVPPTSAEALPMPVWAVRRWLFEQSASSVPDLEGVAPEEEESSESKLPRKFLIWRGPEKSEVGSAGRLQPGDTIIVRSDEGGTDAFGWNPASGDVRDIADECANERARAGRGRYRMRNRAEQVLAGDVEEADLRAAFRRKCQKALSNGRNWRIQIYGPEDSRWLIGVSAWAKPSDTTPEAPSEDTEGDENSSLITESGVPLAEHTGAVRARSQAFVESLGVQADLSEALDWAARLHDLGKLDPRFQMMLDPAGKAAGRGPLAKGLRRNRTTSLADYKKRLEMSGYPRGARHEFASMLLAAQFSSWPNDVVREIALYLIGTHHGHGRAMAPVWFDNEPETLTTEIHGQSVRITEVHTVARSGSPWVDRFWFMQRYAGCWGAAFLESILRRADCMVSREEEQKEFGE